VILIGEMRDTETVRAAIQAAETGHLVMSTLHTWMRPRPSTAVIDFFPPHQQKQVRLALAGHAPRHHLPAAGSRRSTAAGSPRSRSW
jgi:Tfp pilus assembly pilus retraction ATPase PilT